MLVANTLRAIALVKYLVHRKLKVASLKIALDTFSRTNLRRQLFEFSSSPNLTSSRVAVRDNFIARTKASVIRTF